jgi:hypothetical protein
MTKVTPFLAEFVVGGQVFMGYNGGGPRTNLR